MSRACSSENTDCASSNDTLCVQRLACAFFESHSKRIVDMLQVYGLCMYSATKHCYLAAFGLRFELSRTRQGASGDNYLDARTADQPGVIPGR